MLSDRPAGVSGVTFIPQKSGRCVIAAEDYFCDEITGVRLFDVSADENLKISYTCRYADKFFLSERIDFENWAVTVMKDGSSAVLSKSAAVELGNALNGVYGRETPGYINAPDLSDSVKIICLKSTENYDYTTEFYICGDKLYYCDVTAGNEEWHEFIPDEFCSLDGIIGLI